MDIKIIDLKCRSCGGNMDFEKPQEDFIYDFNKVNGNILFYYKKDEKKMTIVCPYCQSKSSVWKSGEETNSFNGLSFSANVNGNNNTVASINIGGSVIGGNIIIGNSKVE